MLPSTQGRNTKWRSMIYSSGLKLHCRASGLLVRFCTLPSGLWDRLTTTLETLEPTGDLLPWTSVCFLVTLMGERAQWRGWRRERKGQKIHPAGGKTGLNLAESQNGSGDFPLALTTPHFGEQFKRMLHFLASTHHLHFSSLDYNLMAFEDFSYI